MGSSIMGSSITGSSITGSSITGSSIMGSSITGSSITGSSIMLLRMAGNAREILPASISSAEAFLPNKTPLPPFGQNCLWWFARMSASENFMRHWEHSIGLCLCSAPKSLRPAISLASLPLSRREKCSVCPCPGISPQHHHQLSILLPSSSSRVMI